MNKCSDCRFAYVKLNEGYLNDAIDNIERNERAYGDEFKPFTSPALVEQVRCGYDVWSPLPSISLLPIVDNIAKTCIYFRRNEDDD